MGQAQTSYGDEIDLDAKGSIRNLVCASGSKAQRNAESICRLSQASAGCTQLGSVLAPPIAWIWELLIGKPSQSYNASAGSSVGR